MEKIGNVVGFMKEGETRRMAEEVKRHRVSWVHQDVAEVAGPWNLD